MRKEIRDAALACAEGRISLTEFHHRLVVLLCERTPPKEELQAIAEHLAVMDVGEDD